MSSYEPDILARDLDVIFCGVNPATTAAVVGHNFSSCSNRFWTVLHLTGFTDVRLQPHEERRLLEYRCGLTAVVARPTRRAIDVPPDEFQMPPSSTIVIRLRLILISSLTTVSDPSGAPPGS